MQKQLAPVISKKRVLYYRTHINRWETSWWAKVLPQLWLVFAEQVVHGRSSLVETFILAQPQLSQLIQQIMVVNEALRQDPPPWFEFLVIFYFFAPWYRRRREASSVKLL